MFNDGHKQQAKCPSPGLLRPGRFLWARAVPWGIVFGIVLWIAYKFVKGVGLDLGLDGSSGVPTVLGVLAALALYVLSVRLMNGGRRTSSDLHNWHPSWPRGSSHVRPAAGVDTLWRGGAFRPEASAANVVMGLLVGAALLALAKRRA
jgi:hypothetical protein